jgi:pyruvate dehydrogenase E2 component (dihydrolipoyllysine-residue acetyltransferase)
MAANLVMPQAGQDLEVGLVRQWYKQVGDAVSLDVEAPIDGVLRRILVTEGSEAPIFGVIGIIGAVDEEIPD